MALSDTVRQKFNAAATSVWKRSLSRHVPKRGPLQTVIDNEFFPEPCSVKHISGLHRAPLAATVDATGGWRIKIRKYYLGLYSAGFREAANIRCLQLRFVPA